MVDFGGVLLGTFCLNLIAFVIKCKKTSFYAKICKNCIISLLVCRRDFVMGLKDAEIATFGGSYSEHFVLTPLVFELSTKNSFFGSCDEFSIITS